MCVGRRRPVMWLEMLKVVHFRRPVMWLEVLKVVHFRGQIASLLLRHGACPSLQVPFLHVFSVSFPLLTRCLLTAGETLARDSPALQREFCDLP